MNSSRIPQVATKPWWWDHLCIFISLHSEVPTKMTQRSVKWASCRCSMESSESYSRAARQAMIVDYKAMNQRKATSKQQTTSSSAAFEQ